MPLTKHIEAIREARIDLQQSNDDAERGPVYLRVCGRNERVSDLLSEAAAHGSILAIKGEVTCIMPELVDGWTKVRGAWRIVQ